VIERKKDEGIVPFVIQIGQPERRDIHFPRLLSAVTKGFSNCRIIDNLYNLRFYAFFEDMILDFSDGFFKMGAVSNRYHDASSSMNSWPGFRVNTPF
jgi:hypothetical protein